MNNLEFELIKNIKEKKKEKLILFLKRFDLKIDLIDFTIIVWDENEIVATASKYANLVKLVAIDENYVGNNLSTTLINKMFYQIAQEGYDSSYLITKIENKSKFIGSGLYKIYQNDNIVYFTNIINKYEEYKDYLIKVAKKNNNVEATAIVLNANPFTKGHYHLIEKARENSKLVYLIPILEDVSFFTYEERISLISKCIKSFDNVILLKGSEYLISKSTFPSYFLSNKEEVYKEQIKLDIGIFYELYCKSLNIKKRYLGTEPYSNTTKNYNHFINSVLPGNDVAIEIIDRHAIDNDIISASKVRKAISEKNYDLIEKMTFKEEWDFLKSDNIYKRAKEYKEKIIKDN